LGPSSNYSRTVDLHHTKLQRYHIQIFEYYMDRRHKEHSLLCGETVKLRSGLRALYMAIIYNITNYTQYVTVSVRPRTPTFFRPRTFCAVSTEWHSGAFGLTFTIACRTLFSAHQTHCSAGQCLHAHSHPQTATAPAGLCHDETSVDTRWMD